MSATLTGLQTLAPGIVVMAGPMLSGGHPLQIGEAIANSFDPRSSGLARPVGSVVYTRNGTTAYLKTGTGNTDWTLQGSSTGSAPLTVVLADATTVTAPDLLVLRHTTSGVAAAGFGGTFAVELESSAGTTRRAMTDATTWVSATDGAEISRRTISVMIAGAPVIAAAFGEFVTVPAFYVGDPAHGTFFRDVSAGLMQLWCGSAVNMTFGAAAVGVNLPLAVSPAATSSGALTKLSLTPGADTGTTLSTEAIDADFNLSRTRTWATGALAAQRSIVMRPPTLAFVGASVVTRAATLAITGAPVAGANATITNSYALHVEAGAVRFDGNFGFGVAPAPASLVAALTNSVTAGGVNDTIANYTDLAVYANDSNAIRNDIHQLARKLAQVVTALRANGLLV